MKRLIKRLLCLCLCAACLTGLWPVSAGAVTLTVVGDTLLPLEDSSMPARIGGELYVPYQVFSSLGVSTASNDGVLTLSAGSQALYFSVAEGYVLDQEQNSYETPAYDRNGTVYVPVKLCCGKFGLASSTFSASGETVLRLTDSAAQSDSSYAAAAADSIERAVNQYYGISPAPETPVAPPPVTPEVPVEPTPPPVEEAPTQKPARVFLAFFGGMTEHTPAVLDALKSAGTQATFFLPTDFAAWTDDNVRRLVAEGHTPALLLYAKSSSDTDALLAQLRAANDRLSLLTGQVTRLVSNANGCDRLTDAQRAALENAGYRLWDSTADSGDDTARAAYAYATTAQLFASTNDAVMLRLRHTAETAETVRLLTAYLQRQGIPAAVPTFSRTPLTRV